jgi:hypothetical protein
MNSRYITRDLAVERETFGTGAAAKTQNEMKPER